MSELREKNSMNRQLIVRGEADEKICCSAERY